MLIGWPSCVLPRNKTATVHCVLTDESLILIGDPMIWRQREPTLKEILSDPIVTALMSADGVDPLELESMLTHIISSKSNSPRHTGRLGAGAWRAGPTYKAQ